jgi:hypothetical protein
MLSNVGAGCFQCYTVLLLAGSDFEDFAEAREFLLRLNITFAIVDLMFCYNSKKLFYNVSDEVYLFATIPQFVFAPTSSPVMSPAKSVCYNSISFLLQCLQ